MYSNTTSETFSPMLFKRVGTHVWRKVSRKHRGGQFSILDKKMGMLDLTGILKETGSLTRPLLGHPGDLDLNFLVKWRREPCEETPTVHLFGLD